MNVRWLLLVSIFISLATINTSQSQAAIKFVKQDAAGDGSGSSWENANPSLANAMETSESGDVLWVAAGIYTPETLRPGTTPGPRIPLGDRDRSFWPSSEISIYGGFAGNETQIIQRDWVANLTVLDGANSYSVISSGFSLVVDGFTIQNGSASTGRPPANRIYGGGAFLDADSIFANCTFSDNFAVLGGAAIYCNDFSFLTVHNCSFFSNSSEASGDLIATGGSAIQGCCSIAISHCNFASNLGPYLFRSSGHITISNSAFEGNGFTLGDYDFLTGSASLVVSNSVLLSIVPGTGNTVAEAGFIDISSGVLQLKSGSPAISHGSAAGIHQDLTDMDGDGDTTELLPLDAAGNPRPSGSPDAGAFQFINLPPTSFELAPQQIFENLPASTPIGAFTTTDPNLDSFSYALVEGAGADDNSSFSISGNQLLSAESFDFETKTSYTIRVRSTELDHTPAESIEVAITIEIIDANDATLTIAAVQPIAYEPHGGVAPGDPHIGRIRVTRTGSTDSPLSAGIYLTTTAANDEYIIEPRLPATLQFAPGETDIDFEVIPLFDTLDPEPVDEFVFTLQENLSEFQLIDPSATITLLGRGNADSDENSNGLSDLIESLLQDDQAPGGFTPPQFDLVSDGGELEHSITLRLNRSQASKFSIVLEESFDLRNWSDSGASFEIVEVTESHRTITYTLPAVGDRHYIRLAVSSADQGETFTISDLGIQMVGIPAGQLILGSPTDEPGRGADEGLQTNVQFLQPFWVGATEITQVQYEALVGSNPSARIGADLPVESLSHAEAAQFCELLNSQEMATGRLPDGHAYRLPTEAEWEYVCRAGNMGATSFSPFPDTAAHAWYALNSFNVIHNVGLKQPNPWGLFDTYGNVAEWCANFYQPSYPGGIENAPLPNPDTGLMAVRGGDINLGASAQRSAFRRQAEPGTRSPVLGFRIVLAPAE